MTDWSESLSFHSDLTFAHSGTVVNDKGSDIFVISHVDSLFVVRVVWKGCLVKNLFEDYERWERQVIIFRCFHFFEKRPFCTANASEHAVCRAKNLISRLELRVEPHKKPGVTCLRVRWNLTGFLESPMTSRFSRLSMPGVGMTESITNHWSRVFFMNEAHFLCNRTSR